MSHEFLKSRFKDFTGLHCVKRVGIRSFLIRIQSECGKIQTRKNSEYGQFSRSVNYKDSLKQQLRSLSPEAATGGSALLKKAFFEILENSQENGSVK